MRTLTSSRQHDNLVEGGRACENLGRKCGFSEEKCEKGGKTRGASREVSSMLLERISEHRQASAGSTELTIRTAPPTTEQEEAAAADGGLTQ